MKRRTILAIVKMPDARASIIQLDNTPAFIGDEQEDLLCGSCGATLGQGISAATLRQHTSAPAQLIVSCPGCKAYNRVPSQAGH